MSPKLAIRILEATGADPVSLLAGPEAKALDTKGLEYAKKASTLSHDVPGYDREESQLLLIKLFHQVQLLFAASNRGGKSKT